jgi:hypothetical protein
MMTTSGVDVFLPSLEYNSYTYPHGRCEGDRFVGDDATGGR